MLAWQYGKGWLGLYTVRMVVHSRTQWRTVHTLRKGHTVVVGVGKKKEKNLTMVA